MSSNLMNKLPVVSSMAGIPNRAMATLLIPFLLIVTAIEAAWDAYILADYSNDLSDFRKIIAGLQVALLALLIIGFCFGWIVGLLMKRSKIVKFLGHIAFLKGLLLFIIGIIHLISVLKNQDEFKSNCSINNSTSFCNTINTINIAFSSALWALQELLLLIIAIATNSLYLQMQAQHEKENQSDIQYSYGVHRFQGQEQEQMYRYQA